MKCEEHVLKVKMVNLWENSIQACELPITKSSKTWGNGSEEGNGGRGKGGGGGGQRHFPPQYPPNSSFIKDYN